jgi:ribosome maturation factor RimP
VNDNATGIEGEVEAHLADALPEIDLLEATVTGRGDSAMLRVVVDHPGGVNHDVCVAVTRALDERGMRERFGIEVWSPGPERPLRTMDHFVAAVGRPVRVTLREPSDAGRRNFTGVLRAADHQMLSLDVDGDSVALAPADIRRAHLIDEKGKERG